MFSAEGQAVVGDEEYLAHSDNANAPAFVTNGASGLVTVGGSTSMTHLMLRLVAAYEAFSGTNARIETQGMGSGAGEIQVAAGSFDIGMVSYEVSNASLESAVLAIDGIAVIVNSANAVSDISMDDLRAVFMGEITRWSELA
jgi:phosphate transport system substrate-binding protein